MLSTYFVNNIKILLFLIRHGMALLSSSSLSYIVIYFGDCSHTLLQTRCYNVLKRVSTVLICGTFIVHLFFISFYTPLPSNKVEGNTGFKVSSSCRHREFEDTKGVIRICISKKNRQHNGQKKKYKRTNNDLQNIHI
jgi:hypothetical protein